MHIANTYVRPILDYAAFVRSLHTANSINKLESVQRRAACYVMSDYNRYSNVNNMLSILNWKSLKQQKDNQSLSILYKILNGLVDVVPPNCVIPNHSVTRGHNKKYHHISSRVDTYKFSFYPRIVPIWNALPEYIVNAPTVDIFNNYNLYPLHYTHLCEVLQL